VARKVHETRLAAAARVSRVNLLPAIHPAAASPPCPPDATPSSSWCSSDTHTTRRWQSTRIYACHRLTLLCLWHVFTPSPSHTHKHTQIRFSHWLYSVIYKPCVLDLCVCVSVTWGCRGGVVAGVGLEAGICRMTADGEEERQTFKPTSVHSPRTLMMSLRIILWSC